MLLRRAALALLLPGATPGASAGAGSLFYRHDGHSHHDGGSSGGDPHAKHPAHLSDSNSDGNDDSVEDRCATIAASFRALGRPPESKKSVVFQCRSTYGTQKLPDGYTVQAQAGLL